MNEWMNELNELPSSKFILIETKWNLLQPRILKLRSLVPQLRCFAQSFFFFSDKHRNARIKVSAFR
jgi:hypothetical protein